MQNVGGALASLGYQTWPRTQVHSGNNGTGPGHDVYVMNTLVHVVVGHILIFTHVLWGDGIMRNLLSLDTP